MSQPIYFVSGATGNVGAQVVEQLQKQGVQVRAGDLQVERITERFGAAVQPAAFDFGRPETFAPALQGVEGLFLMRPPQITDVEKYMFPAVDAAVSAGVRRIAFLSLIGIEENTRVPHYKVEQYLKAGKTAYTFLRASYFMQNLNTTHREEIRQRDEIYIPVGKARTSFIDVRDIAAVAALALTVDGHANQAYDLTGGEALDYHQVADLFSEILGRKIEYKHPAVWQYAAYQLQHGQPLAYTLVTAWLYNNTRRGMAERVTGEVQRLLGRSPIRMRQYIQDYQEYWQR
jgi:uncharacterized protein YbjT (DUF2867 family)